MISVEGLTKVYQDGQAVPPLRGIALTVARAVAGSPALVIADEPTAYLDSAAAQEVLGLFANLNAELGPSFLISSHDPQVLARARRVVRFHDGRVAADGPP